MTEAQRSGGRERRKSGFLRGEVGFRREDVGFVMDGRLGRDMWRVEVGSVNACKMRVKMGWRRKTEWIDEAMRKRMMRGTCCPYTCTDAGG